MIRVFTFNKTSSPDLVLLHTPEKLWALIYTGCYNRKEEPPRGLWGPFTPFPVEEAGAMHLGLSCWHWVQRTPLEGFQIFVSQNKDLNGEMWIVASKRREFVKNKYPSKGGSWLEKRESLMSQISLLYKELGSCVTLLWALPALSVVFLHY